MTPAEMLEVTKLYSVAGMLPPGQPLIRHRPFRDRIVTITRVSGSLTFLANFTLVALWI